MYIVRVKCKRACQQSRKANEASSPNRESWGQAKDLALQLHGCKTIPLWPCHGGPARREDSHIAQPDPSLFFIISRTNVNWMVI